MRLHRYLYIALALGSILPPAAALRAQQQTGSLAGHVTDRSSGDRLVGVNVVLSGTPLGAATDLDGAFLIRKIPAGTYDVRVSAVGYQAVTVTGVVVDRDVALNVTLEEATAEVEGVVVTADAVRSNETAILAERKRAAAISDAVSAEQIKRTPDATSGDALKRVTGVALVENKFIYVRGVTDRYNETTLDGVPVAGTESGKKSFSFDLLPANLLDHTSIIKSATPDLPGDFSGGLVQLNTIDFPDRRVISIGAGTGYNTATSGQQILRSQEGNKDWLGTDDGIRAYPGDAANATVALQRAQNTWAPVTRKAPYNSNLSLSLGDRLNLADDGSSEIGAVVALSYKDSYQRNNRVIDDYEVSRLSKGTEDDYTVLWGGILNVSAKVGGLHKISLRSNFNQTATDAVKSYHVDDNSVPLEDLYSRVEWQQRGVVTTQLSGEHSFPVLHNLQLQWHGSLSSAHTENPDIREATYYRDPTDPTQPFTIAVSHRQWSSLNDNIRSAGTDIAVPAGTLKFKTGADYRYQTTDFKIRSFDISPDYFPGRIPDSLTHLPLDVIYSPENYGRGKYLVKELTVPSDGYRGSERLLAGYLMADVPFAILGQEFRFVGGARVEKDAQTIAVPKTLNTEGPSTQSAKEYTDVLPSANLTVLLTPDMNLRLAASQSVNRPEFRERAPTAIYDFVKYQFLKGDTALQRAYVHNFDIRWEYFPSPGEVVGISWFRKTLSNAIEEAIIPSATRIQTWVNSRDGSASGWEFEFRKSLGFAAEYLRGTTLSGNYTRVESSVATLDVAGNSAHTVFVEGTRPLQGQSPYTLNFGATFTEPHINTTASILYNKFGRRLYAVGGRNAADIYEEPREATDLSIVQPFPGGLELKFTIKNLTEKDQILTKLDRLYQRTITGKTYAVTVSAGL